MITGKVDGKRLLSFCGHGAAIPEVSEVNDQTETRKSHAFEKAVCPDLQ